MIDHIKQSDAVLAEDGRAVVVYCYPADNDLDVTVETVVPPIAINERNFMRGDWERASMSLTR